MKPDLSVVVVNWNGGTMLGECLDCLGAQIGVRTEVLIVDNGSTDGSASIVHGRLPMARLISLDRNVGFAAAASLGLRRGIAPWRAVLNNDCFVDPGWSEAALAAAHVGDRPGMVATLQLDHRRERIDAAGIGLDRAGIAWNRLGGCAPNAMNGGPVFGPSGGAALYSAAMLADVGAFDGQFFAYYEDVDLAWRARLRGWGCGFAPEARSLHVGAATVGWNSPRQRHLIARNKVWTIFKCMAAADVPAAMTLDTALGVAFALAAPVRPAALASRLASLAGRAAAWRGVHHQLAKRRSIQGSRRADPRDWMAPFPTIGALQRRFGYLADRRSGGR